jgi:hypothetical protein
MFQRLPLCVRDALQSQPPTHFGYENGENFFRFIKKRNTFRSNRHIHNNLKTFIVYPYHLYEDPCLAFNFDADPDKTYHFDAHFTVK